MVLLANEQHVQTTTTIHKKKITKKKFKKNEKQCKWCHADNRTDVNKTEENQIKIK